jgi:Na+/proline symporter/signal transduction histidine kinase/ActR/RegA family two-component response regulator
MIEGWVIVVLALAYLGGLFAVAWVGDHTLSHGRDKARPLIYALSIGAYCSSWTFFGSVGSAATTGYDFLPTYVGPLLLFVFGWRLIQRVVRIAKAENITSVADFISARYGKSQTVAALVTLIAVVGALPYMALQLKAVSLSVETLLGSTATWRLNLPFDTAFVVALAMAIFASLFGTRHADATEHQDGLILAIAAESIIKLAAFLAVGAFIAVTILGTPLTFIDSVLENTELAKIFATGLHTSVWITVTLLSFIAVLLLPRQFHVIVVENKSETEVRSARWLFPLYLIAINIFVVPIAVAGLTTLPKGSFSPDTFVLALPLTAGANIVTMIGFIGGLSAATAMVIIDSIAVSIMVCNGVVVPLLLRRRVKDYGSGDPFGLPLLAIRRCAIFVLLAGSYGVYHLIGQGRGLVAIGLVSFAATAQLAPAFFGALFWRRATSRGAVAGLTVGFAVWIYTLVMPWLAESGFGSLSLVANGPFGIAALAPQSLFHLKLDPLSHGVFWSLLANCVAYVAASLSRAQDSVERTQAAIFTLAQVKPRTIQPASASALPHRLWRTTITIGELQATVARYLGAERTDRAFADYFGRQPVPIHPGTEADVQVITFAEHLLASAVGAASSRLILSLLLRRGQTSQASAARVLDATSEALRFNRDLLQSAMDEVRHGLGVFDKDLKLIFWSRQFRDMLRLPGDVAQIGTSLDQMLRACAVRGDFGLGNIDQLVARRMNILTVKKETYQEYLEGGRRVLEIGVNSLPQGGIAVTLLDITERFAAAEALARANQGLERRVLERTSELLDVNNALALAKAKADEANREKTRFLNAASHDVMQPLNAARLYMSSLVERQIPEAEGAIVRNIDASLEAVEEILSTLIDIARLDAGRMEPDIAALSLNALFEQLAVEFAPLAKSKALTLQTGKTDLWVMSDRRLLKRVLQNLVANAIKYTPRGTVMLSARSDGRTVTVAVADTGPGIPVAQLANIFKEFQRLKETAESVRGLGLGLSIVERIARMLGHPVAVRSTVGRGSTFTIDLPVTNSVIADATAPAALIAQSGIAGVTVMCIDNEPAVLAGMDTLLTGWGCHVLKAATIEQAVALARSAATKPDLILSDYHLDLGNGLDAVAAIRAALQSAIPAVIITAEASTDVQRQVREKCDALLRKPIKAAQLRAVIAQLARQRVAAE